MTILNLVAAQFSQINSEVMYGAARTLYGWGSHEAVIHLQQIGAEISRHARYMMGVSERCTCVEQHEVTKG